MMDMFHVLACVLFSYGLAAPVADLDLNKRRESTPEILGLEKELKKAAGENKQYFSNPNSRPMPQIDGLDTNNEQLKNSVAEETPLSDPSISDDSQDDIGNEPARYDVEDGSQQESYLSMWKLFKQHPEYMEQMYQDYLANPEGRVIGMNEIEAGDNPEYENVKRASEVGVFAYPSENELLVGGAPYQSKHYVSSDEGDRTAALMADYAAAAASRYPFTPQSQEDIYDMGDEEEEEGDEDEDHDMEEQSEEDENQLESLESQEGDEESSESDLENLSESQLADKSKYETAKTPDGPAVPPVM